MALVSHAGCGSAPGPPRSLSTTTRLAVLGRGPAAATGAPPSATAGAHGAGTSAPVIPLGPGTLAAQVLSPVTLRTAPGGARLATAPPRTTFGSARVLAVVSHRRGWLGVLVSERPDDRPAWVALTQRLSLLRVRTALEASLSQRLLVLRRDDKVVMRAPVAVGRPTAPTPVGRFAVTDRLLIQGASPYGCCALALSGHQPAVPQGWGGGDRLAVHGTEDPASVGQAVSLGCLRAAPSTMRALVDQVQLGSVLTVRP